MVAYSFKAQFREPILAGTKRRTIRADRKRHARVGEDLQLYTGMRTLHCKLIGIARCIGVQPVRIGVRLGGYVELADQVINCATGLAAFAHSDGFESWLAMVEFWHREHPDVITFSGVMIQWDKCRSSATDCR